jgi:hypothetical protein
VQADISGSGIVDAAIFRSQNDYGELVQLNFRQRVERDTTCTDINVAHLVPPPWRVAEFFVGDLGGMESKRYTTISCTNSGIDTRSLHNFDQSSSWTGNILVVGHTIGHIGELTNVGEAELDGLIAALSAVRGR